MKLTKQNRFILFMKTDSKFYIPRNLTIDGKIVKQDILSDDTKATIVLAEPGAGKTELLENIAKDLGVEIYRASRFRHATKINNTEILIIDGLDEVAKIDDSAIDYIITKASELNPRKVIFTSRSGQWENARSLTLKEEFGKETRTAYLSPFDEKEQEALFIHYKPELNFDKFKIAVTDLNLTDVLGNPQMLKILADAFDNRNGEFGSPHEIFKDAIEQLASENDEKRTAANRISEKQITNTSDEIFAKVLLSGATGVSLTKKSAEHEFPHLTALLPDNNIAISQVVETGIFKPSSQADHHEPIHRIIAEYSAARYIVQQIQNPKNTITLNRVLSLIAPNDTPRDELRGLLAWMSAEGDEAIQQGIINIDPYAILSNGDPSRLSASSKSKLITSLDRISQENPYFRGADIWRSFSTEGFFTADTTDEVRRVLLDKDHKSQLPGLLLELLRKTPAALVLQELLQDIILDIERDVHIRTMALAVVLDIPEFNFDEIVEHLVSEDSIASITIVSRITQRVGVEQITQVTSLEILHSIDRLFFSPPNRGTRKYRDRPSRYFIRNLVSSFETSDIVFFLNALSDEMKCKCGEKYAHNCECRTGRTHLIGLLLDQLYINDDYNPTAEQIWAWVKNLNFEHQSVAKESPSVMALQNDDTLRQAVQNLAFRDCKTENDVFEVKLSFNLGHGHSGINFQSQDIRALTDRAFNEDNILLWSMFCAGHQYYRKEEFDNPDRAHMKQQALEKREFGYMWAKRERSHKKSFHENRPTRFRRSSRMRKNAKIEHANKVANQQHFDENINEIEQGKDFFWLEVFADGYLHDNAKHFPRMSNQKLPEISLLNSFDFLEKHIPSLKDIGMTSGTYNIVKVAHAACLAEFRSKGNLSGIHKKIVTAVKTTSNVHYTGGTQTDKEDFIKELNRCVFESNDDVESFARDYVESQLANSDKNYADVYTICHTDDFKDVRSKLPLEWLEKYPEIKLHDAETLFNCAALYGDRDRLLKVIETQITSIGQAPEDEEELKEYNNHRNFWFVRKLFFDDTIDASTLEWLEEDRDHLLVIKNVAGELRRNENPGWNDLSSEKIQTILNIYIDQWAKVHLPDSYGTGDPPEEIAYRFLTEIVWKIGTDAPEKALAVIDELSSDERFIDFETSFKVQKSDVLKKLALQNFAPPEPDAVVEFFHKSSITTVEDLRTFVIELLHEYQAWLDGGETNTIKTFYNDDKRVDENTGTERVVDYLKHRCDALGLSITIEHQLFDKKRCDITLRTIINGQEKLLVIEVKGQWNKELYSAASEQLEQRYMLHPNAEHQGIYLVFWFGEDEKIASVKDTKITNSEQLSDKIIELMPVDLRPKIDVFVLDLTK